MELWMYAFLGIAVIILLVNFWWFAIGRQQARHDRDWTADCAQTPHFSLDEDGDSFTLHNRREFTWRTTKDFDEKEVKVALNEYSNRFRKYGSVS